MDLSQPNGMEGLAVVLEQTLADNKRLVKALQDIRDLGRCCHDIATIIDTALNPGVCN